jgi:L-fuconolactonase
MWVYPTEKDWLASTTEAPVDGSEEIVDPHHHLWDRPDGVYMVPDLHMDTGAGHNVTQTVFVECGSAYLADGPESMRPVGETSFVAACAGESADAGGARISGIVSMADLQLGEAVEKVLEEHERRGQGLFRGIRQASAFDKSPGVRRSHARPPDGLLGLDDFRRGFTKLGEMGYSFDAWLFHPQIDELVDLVRAHPKTPVVLDHLGGPLAIGPYEGKREEVRAHVRGALERLAAHDQVVLKVGGIGMTIFDRSLRHLPSAPTSDYMLSLWGEDLAHAIDTFGPSRCMFESNFPVDKQGCGYTVLWNTFQKACDAQGYTPAERADLFAGTARRFYRLD